MSKDGASEGTSEWKYVLKRALLIIITITNILSPCISSLPHPSVLGRYSPPPLKGLATQKAAVLFSFAPQINRLPLVGCLAVLFPMPRASL